MDPGGAGLLVIVVAMVTLVLSQTVFRPDPGDPAAGGETSSAETEDPESTRPSEYVPSEEPSDEADGETTFAPQPAVDCTVHKNEVVTEQIDGVVRGGGLEFPVQEGWEVGADPPELVDYRDEATTIDGHPAWIVIAEVQVSDLALLHTTEAWRQVVIVVDTPDGPAAFDGGAATGHDQQVQDLETMLEGLRVL